jgi:hypothetical protein
MVLTEIVGVGDTVTIPTAWAVQPAADVPLTV